MNAPERIWAWPAGNAASTSIYSCDDVDTHGLVSYTRSDLCDRDAIRAEAFEEAAERIQRRIDSYIRDHGDCDYDPETGFFEITPNVVEEIEASEDAVKAIRALMRPAGEQKERTAQALSDLAELDAALLPDRLRIGTRVRKTKGSSWQGRIVGRYSTSLTPEGYAVESEREPGSVQIYPRAALVVIEEGNEA